MAQLRFKKGTKLSVRNNELMYLHIFRIQVDVCLITSMLEEMVLECTSSLKVE